MKPNIFDIATKELTQDAFITWLLKFADEKNRDFDLEMNECGKMFDGYKFQQIFKCKG